MDFSKKDLDEKEYGKAVKLLASDNIADEDEWLRAYVLASVIAARADDVLNPPLTKEEKAAGKVRPCDTFVKILAKRKETINVNTKDEANPSAPYYRGSLVVAISKSFSTPKEVKEYIYAHPEDFSEYIEVGILGPKITAAVLSGALTEVNGVKLTAVEKPVLSATIKKVVDK